MFKLQCFCRLFLCLESRTNVQHRQAITIGLCLQPFAAMFVFKNLNSSMTIDQLNIAFDNSLNAQKCIILDIKIQNFLVGDTPDLLYRRGSRVTSPPVRSSPPRHPVCPTVGTQPVRRTCTLLSHCTHPLGQIFAALL